jgi:hypothetical protein
VELHSEIDSYWWVLTLRTPEGQKTTVIIMRRKSAVRLTLNGTEKTTVVMVEEASQLTEAVSAAAGDAQ